MDDIINELWTRYAVNVLTPYTMKLMQTAACIETIYVGTCESSFETLLTTISEFARSSKLIPLYAELNPEPSASQIAEKYVAKFYRFNVRNGGVLNDNPYDHPAQNNFYHSRILGVIDPDGFTEESRTAKLRIALVKMWYGGTWL